MRQKQGRELFWRGRSAGFRPGTHITKLCSFSQGFMSRVCLLLQRGALAALRENPSSSFAVAVASLYQSLCRKQTFGSCMQQGSCADPQIPALDLPCGLCARPAGDIRGTVAALKPGWWREACSCIHFTACYLDILWRLLRRGGDFCSSVAFLWDR